MKYYNMISADQKTVTDWILLLKAEKTRALDNDCKFRDAHLECLIFDAEEFKKEMFG